MNSGQLEIPKSSSRSGHELAVAKKVRALSEIHRVSSWQDTTGGKRITEWAALTHWLERRDWII